MNRCVRILSAITLSALSVGFAACSPGGGEVGVNDSSDVLVAVGDSVLRMREVLVRIPSGMEPEDSALLFNTLVESWMERMLIEDLARENIQDIEQIERLVADYRKKLIISSYRKQLREAGKSGVDEKMVKRYYAEHEEEMILERPVLKGLYVKVPSDAKRLGDIRRWMMTATPDAIDNLERYGLEEAIEYSFFEDSWTDWNIPSRQIPYRFEDADAFVKGTENFETSYGGMTYILHIKEYLQSGEKMPYEVAAPIIHERLEMSQGEDYERKIMDGIYRQARREGKLRYVNYK